MRFVVLVAMLLAASAAFASDATLTGTDGHPRERLPLALYIAPFRSPALDLTASRVVADWNQVARETLGVDVFRVTATAQDAHVRVTVLPRTPGGPMGVTLLESNEAGIIRVPVQIAVDEPAPRGQTSLEVLLYQVLAHELGHALGLAHTTDPRSLMCCVHASLDFKDPVVREAYVDARRHPDIGSVRTQLGAHYERFWRK